MSRLSLAHVAGAAAVAAIAVLPVLGGCGPDVETCVDQLELRFDQEVERDYVAVLEIDGEVARIDCSLASYPTEGGANPVEIEVDLEGTIAGRASCTTRAILLGLTPEAGTVSLTYRGLERAEFELLEADFSVAYDEVEARDRTCRQGVVVLDVGCVGETTTCGTTDEDGSGSAGGSDLPT